MDKIQRRWKAGIPARALAGLLLVLLCLGSAACSEAGASDREAAAVGAAARGSAVASGVEGLPGADGEGRITAADVPEYTGEASVEINGGIPAFTAEDLARTTFEEYAPLDSLGRCGTAFALVSDDTRPANGEKRGNISAIKPTGWVQGRYEDLPDGSLYNRSHLIAWSLGAENDNPRNLITGTVSMNQGVMQGVESRILAYIRNTGNHVLVRVTPVFVGNELLARGVQYEALSIEDGGRAVCVNEFMFNVQPGIQLDYATGENRLAVEGEADAFGMASAAGAAESATPEAADAGNDSAAPGAAEGSATVSGSVGDTASAPMEGLGTAAGAAAPVQAVEEQHCILNTNTGKIHRPGCSAVAKMKDKNKQDFTGIPDDLLSQGYDFCKLCW